MTAIGPRKAHGRASSGDVVLIDLRESGDWLAVAPPRSVHVPPAELPEHIPGIEALGLPVVFLCADGRFSALAADLLLLRAQMSASSVDGGFRRWLAEGVPVRSSVGQLARRRAPCAERRR